MVTRGSRFAFFIASASFIFCGVFSGAASAATSNEIRVRIQSLAKGPLAVSGIALRFPGSPAAAMGFQSLKISWKSASKLRTSWTVEDRDSGQVLSRFEARTLELTGMSMRVGLQSVPERLSFAPRPTGSLDVIAKLDLESYVRGVLPSEMPASWPLEALKAQAIAARTFAIFRKQARAKVNATYDVESDVMDQVYKNPLGDDALSGKKSDMVERAIRETKGIVLLAGGTHPFATFFHADCGGHTEEPGEVWGPSESVGTTSDESCPTNPLASWNLKLSAAEIAEKYKSASRLQSVKILERTSSGRIGKLQLKWADGTVKTTSGHEFRMTLGHSRIRSAKFDVAKAADGNFEFAGQGFGHGVGMCQWGARHLAKTGKGFRDILGHYFPKAAFSDAPAVEAGVASRETPEEISESSAL